MMNEQELLQYTQKLANFISLHEFEHVTNINPYYHMGATIVDAALQAGLNYNRIVYPRVQRLLTEYANYRTTCDFLILMQIVPLHQLIKWTNQRKLQVIHDMSWLFFQHGIETEKMLAKWLVNSENIYQLKNINGIGPKTIDYLQILSGNQAIAVDRHLFSFLEQAGICVNSYNDASLIYNSVAELLGVEKYQLDRQIWLLISKR